LYFIHLYKGVLCQQIINEYWIGLEERSPGMIAETDDVSVLDVIIIIIIISLIRQVGSNKRKIQIKYKISRLQ